MTVVWITRCWLQRCHYRRSSRASLGLGLTVPFVLWVVVSVLKQRTQDRDILTVKTNAIHNNKNEGTDNVPRPPLTSLLQFTSPEKNELEIKGDVQFLLDFALIGNPKCATSSTMRWLASHPEIAMFEHEMDALAENDPAYFVSRLYEDLPWNQQQQIPLKRGYKNPADISRRWVLDSFANYWPTTKLIVGMRHPIWWFQSYYNFRVRFNLTLPDATDPMFVSDDCQRKSARQICARFGGFHRQLVLLGKTPLNTTEELALFAPRLPRHFPEHDYIPNKIFLYEINQASPQRGEDVDHDPLFDQYRHDLSNYLGLQTPLDVPKHATREHRTDGNYLATLMDICEDQHSHLRKVLLKHGTHASQWIREYFMPHPDVVVSNPEHFQQLLRSWSNDPCEEQRRR